MRNLKIILISIMISITFGLFIHGCNTEEYNLRTIRDNRTYISSDSTSYNMKWRTNSWVTKNAKYWSSASVIITSVDNTLGGGQSSYWLKKIVEKGFKGTVLIEENFDYLPLSYVSENSNTYKKDLYTYFNTTLENENWYVKTDLGSPILYDHPIYGTSYILNPLTVNTWANGAYDIFNTYANALRESVEAEETDFVVGIFRSYNQSSWKPFEDYSSDMITYRADPLSLSKNIGSYTSSEMNGFNVLLDDHVSRIKGKNIPLVVYGNRLDTVTDKIEDLTITGVFFENVTSENYRDIVQKSYDYRDTFEPENTEQSLMSIMGIINDVYHEVSPTAYANMIKSIIDSGSYFTPGANSSYFEFPSYNPGNWWIRTKNDLNWQNNRNNPDYDNLAYHPRKAFGVTPSIPDADVTPPAIPDGIVVTENEDGTITLNWGDNIEGDFSHYNIYRSETTGNTGLTPHETGIISSSFTDEDVIDETEYFYQITSVDTSDNESDKSDEVSGTSYNETPPSAPTNLTASGTVQDYAIVLNWDENTESDLASYEIYRDGSHLGTVLAGTETYIDTDFDFGGIVYTYKIKAKNNKDIESDFSNESSDYAGNRVPPIPPSTFELISGDLHVLLAWYYDEIERESDFSGVKIYRGNSQNSIQFLRTLEGQTASTGDYTAWDTSLPYYYKISAYDIAGNESSLISPTPEYAYSFNIVKPITPTSFSCNGGDLEIDLYWTSNIGIPSGSLTVNDLDHYELHRSTEGSGFTPSQSNLIATLTVGTYIDTDVTYNTQYWYKLYGVDWAGNKSSIPASTNCITNGIPIDVTPPAVPTGLTSTAYSGHITLDWNSNTEEDFSYYNVYRSEVIAGIEQPYILLNDESGIYVSNYDDTTTLDNTIYRFKISAVDDASPGNESEKSSYTEAVYYDGTPPEVPTGLSATTNLDRRINLSWSAIANSAGDFSHYIIYRGSSPTSTSQLFNNVTTTSYTDNTITNGIAYYYQVASVDLIGNVSSKSTAAFGFGVDNIAPAAPTGVSATAGESTVTISWNPNGESDIDRYTIYRSSNGTDWELAQVSTVYHPTTSTSIAATPNVLRYYSVFAVDNAAGANISSRSSVVSATAYDTPVAPVLVLGATTGNGLTVNLSWTYSEPSDMKHYNIMRGTTSSNLIFLKTVSETSTSTSDTPTSGTWYYAITAEDDGGRVSSLSNVVNVTTLDTSTPNTPQNLEIVSQTEGSWALNASSGTTPTITLSWDENVGDSTTHYRILRGTSAEMEISQMEVASSLIPKGTTTWSDSYYNVSTNPNGFVNGSPYWYKVIALNTTGGIPSISNGSNEVTWTPRCVRELKTPFYYAQWIQDHPNITLSSAEWDSVSVYDGMLVANFEFYSHETSRNNMITEIRNRNSDIILYTYINIQGPRNDWQSAALGSPFRQIWDFCSSEMDGELDRKGLTGNDGFLKDINGNILSNGIYPTKIINFGRQGVAQEIARIYVEAYQNSPYSAEYTGLYLDFINSDFQSWIANPNIIDPDEDGVPYSSDSDDKMSFQQYGLDVVSSIRKEYANRKLTNRLLMINGNGTHSNSISSPIPNFGNILSSYLDGWCFEYFSHASGYGTPGYPTTKEEISGLISRSSSLTSQINPPSIMWEAHADSNTQYMSEVMVAAQNGGWIGENGWTCYNDVQSEGQTYSEWLLSVIEDNLRAQWSGTSTTNIANCTSPTPLWVGYPNKPNTPVRNGNRIPIDIGDYVSTTYIDGVVSSLVDTMVVDYENVRFHLALGKQGAVSQYYPWAYFVENKITGGVIRRSSIFPTPYPSAPTGLTAIGSTNSSVSKYIDLDWNDVTNFGYKNGFGTYNIYRSISGGTPTYYRSTNVSNYRDTGITVTNGVTYSYQVTVTNDRGISLESTKTSIVNGTSTDVVAPSTLTGFSAIVGDGYITLSWNPITGDNVSYIIEVETLSPIETLSTSRTISGLTNGFEYTVSVYARDVNGNSGIGVGGNYTPTGGVEPLEFTLQPTLNSISDNGGFIQYNWSAELGTIANTKSVFYKNSEAIPDTSLFDWDIPERYISKTIVTDIQTPERDSSTNITLFWTQETSPDTYVLERKVDNGSWTSLSSSIDGDLRYYTDTTSPRGKIEYRIAPVTNSVQGSWVLLSKVDGVADDTVYNESIELHTFVDIAKIPNTFVRSTPVPLSDIYVAPLPLPVTDFSVSQTSGTTSTVFNFTSSTTNSPTDWVWTFGDGDVSYEENPSHTYSAIGTYTVSLTASNETGSDTETKIGLITIEDRITAGLVALYEFDEGSGSVIYDTSGYLTALNLDINNVANVSWVNGGLDVVSATHITSQSNATKIIDACQATNEFTFELWVQPEQAIQPISGSGPSRIITIGNTISENNIVIGHGNQLGGASARISPRVFGLVNLESSLSVTATPMHIVYTRDSSNNAVLYINGVQDVSGTQAVTLSSSWTDDQILRLANSIGLNRAWYGTYYLVAIYNRDLSSAEVLQNYNASTSTQAITPLFQ